VTFKFCKQEGRALPTSIGGWYRGVGVQAGTVAPITAIQMMVNGILQGTVLRGEAREVTAAENIACAMGAGAFSALVYSPVDLTTIQQQKLNLSPGATMAHIVREHGAAGVFRGFMSMALREAIYTGGYLGLAPVLSSQFSEMAAFENSP
jgi:solute carrier family 25 2-oxodicarboxylate transporter 21